MFRTLKEMFTNDMRRFRVLYQGLAPLMISMSILMVASFAAVFAKKIFLFEVRKQEKRDFFKSIDWTQPEKIKDEDIRNNGPDNQIIVKYLRKAICPSILLFGAVASQPFFVISMHVINTRYNN